MKKILIALGLFVLSLTFIIPAANANPKEPNITFCHRTASFSNPYVKITTDANSIFKKGHDTHNGPVFDGVTKPWGDIIPPFTYNEDSYPGKNWNTKGQAILAAGCNVVTPTPTDSPTPVVTVSPTPDVTVSPTPETTVSPTPGATSSPTPGVTESPAPVTSESPSVVPPRKHVTPPPTVLPMTGFRGNLFGVGIVLLVLGLLLWFFGRLP